VISCPGSLLTVFSRPGITTATNPVTERSPGKVGHG